MAAAAGAAARGGSIPDAGVGDRPPGKPVALADITNTGKPNPRGSVTAMAEVLKENAKLRHLLAERTKIIEISRIEILKIRQALQSVQQKNLQLAQANSQMLAELNQGKDRLKAMQHELSCSMAVLKVKDSELEEIKAMSSRRTQAKAHQKAKAAVPPSNYSCQEHLQDETSKRSTNRRKTESREITKDTNTVQHSCKPHVKSSGSLHGDDLRKPLRRRSARLNLGPSEVSEVASETLHETTKDSNTVQHSCKPHVKSSGSLHGDGLRRPLRRRSARLNPESSEVSEVASETLREDIVVPLAPSSSSIPEQQELNAGKDMGKSLINELPCDYVAHKQEGPEHKEEIEAGRSMHKIDKDTNTDPEHLAVTKSSQPFNTEHSEVPQGRGHRRKSMCTAGNKRKVESREGQMASSTEDGFNTECHSSSSMSPLHHKEKRKLSRRKSSRLDPRSCEDTNVTFEIVQEDTILAAPTDSDFLVEQTKSDMQNGSSFSSKPSEDYVTGRRSSVGRPSRRATEKIISYKEIPLNVKMRRP